MPGANVDLLTTFFLVVCFNNNEQEFMLQLLDVTWTTHVVKWIILNHKLSCYQNSIHGSRKAERIYSNSGITETTRSSRPCILTVANSFSDFFFKD